jgi:hypothetical protein
MVPSSEPGKAVENVDSNEIKPDTVNLREAMIDDWIYNNPTWLWGTVLVALFTAASCVGLLVFHRLVHVSVRRAHNDLAGLYDRCYRCAIRGSARLHRYCYMGIIQQGV